MATTSQNEAARELCVTVRLSRRAGQERERTIPLSDWAWMKMGHRHCSEEIDRALREWPRYVLPSSPISSRC
jgi:hypothetical protein